MTLKNICKRPRKNCNNGNYSKYMKRTFAIHHKYFHYPFYQHKFFHKYNVIAIATLVYFL